MKLSPEAFKMLCSTINLNLNYIYSPAVRVSNERDGPVTVSLVAPDDCELFMTGITPLPAPVVHLDMEFKDGDEAAVWCVNNIRACAINADWVYQHFGPDD